MKHTRELTGAVRDKGSLDVHASSAALCEPHLGHQDVLLDDAEAVHTPAPSARARRDWASSTHTTSPRDMSVSSSVPPQLRHDFCAVSRGLQQAEET